MAPNARSIHVFFEPAPRSLSIRDVMSGVSESDTMPLAMMEMMIVIENSRKMRPMRSLRNTSGMKTAASDSVIAMIVKLISFADSSEA